MVINAPTALITGCSSGIGEALALEFASRGVHVFATARRVESLKELTEKHDNIEALSLDLDDFSGIERLRDEIVNRTGGRLDYLVNNAGTHYAATGLDLDVDVAMSLYKVNVFAVMRLCQVFVPLLSKGSSPKIVQIGSVTRDLPVVWQAAYNSSKAALTQYTRTLRLELEPFGIQVVEVVTGYVKSNIMHHGFYAPETSLYLPIQRIVEDIKYTGHRNGMETQAYARSVVSKVMQKRASPEYWEGRSAKFYRILVAVLPLTLLNLVMAWVFKLNLLKRSTKKMD